MTEEKKIKVTFLPGSFDNFDGTQEELDELVAEITRLAESGELMERSVEVDYADIAEELNEEEAAAIMEYFQNLDATPRKLN